VAVVVLALSTTFVVVGGSATGRRIGAGSLVELSAGGRAPGGLAVVRDLRAARDVKRPHSSVRWSRVVAVVVVALGVALLSLRRRAAVAPSRSARIARAGPLLRRGPPVVA
jgi:hypothetical protein